MARRRVGTTDARLTALEREVAQLRLMLADRGLAVPIAKPKRPAPANPVEPHADRQGGTESSRF